MTGLAASGSYLYLGSQTQNKTYRYTLPNISNRANFLYFNEFNQTRDIVRTPDNNIWVASDNAGVVLALYNTSNTKIDYIMSYLVPYARGVAMDPDGYLWVSDIVNDKLYKIDLTEGIEDEHTSVSEVTLTTSANPFIGSVLITGTGFAANAMIEIFDLQGRLVSNDPFDGAFNWDAAVANGIFFAVVRDDLGNCKILELVKL